MTATPRPWRLDHDNCTIVGADGMEVAGGIECFLDDAAFIVEAVNSYDRNRETIKALVEALEAARPVIFQAIDLNDESWKRETRESILRQVDAALEAARKGQEE